MSLSELQVQTALKEVVDPTTGKDLVFPDSVLPPVLATWEQNIAASKGATLAQPSVGLL